jgi:hypothetical protein
MASHSTDNTELLERDSLYPVMDLVDDEKYKQTFPNIGKK